MKRFICYFLLISITLCIGGCKTFNTKELSKNEIIAAEISKIENIDSYSDETIKTLSIIYRTSFDDIKNNSFSNINERVLYLTNETKNELLEKPLTINTFSNEWSEVISKSEILEFFKTKQEYLSNISNIEIIEDENNNASILKIASKEIDFIEFSKYFNLSSNKNINIENKNSFIKINGYGKGFNFEVDIDFIENLSKLGYNHSEILLKIIK